MKCSVSHCSEPISTKSYCSAHYQRAYRGKDPEAHIIKPKSSTCPAQGCSKPANPGTVCPKHSTDIRLHRIPPIPGVGIKPNPMCIFPECDRASRQTFGGYCRTHVAAILAGEELKPLQMRSGLEFCAAEEGCELPSETRGLCRRHYSRQKYALNPPERIMQQCATDGCPKTTSKKNPSSNGAAYCSWHRKQFEANGVTWLKGQRPPMGTCLIEWCAEDTFAPRQVCKAHRERNRPYNLSIDQILDLWRDPRCAICSSPNDLNIDHDHACCPGFGSCGKCVRGLLCRDCNFALGSARDSIETLEGMISYLKKSCK